MKIVLVEPETPGNIGAVARVMKNFGFKELVIVNPKCDILSSEAIARAKHAVDVLKNAKILDNFDEIKKISDILIGTTGKIKSKWEFRKRYYTPWEIAEMFLDKNVAIIFGRESIGLTNEELSKCDLLSHIPTHEEYPIMNLSHAVGIYVYEFFRLKVKRSKVRPLNTESLRHLFNLIDKIVELKEEKRNFEREELARVIKDIIIRARPEEKEIKYLFSFLKILYDEKRVP